MNLIKKTLLKIPTKKTLKTLQDFKSKSKNDSCLIIGNGPSLNELNFDYIKKEIDIYATNRTIFHPKFNTLKNVIYCISDNEMLFSKKNLNTIKKIYDSSSIKNIVVPSSWYYYDFFNKSPKLLYLNYIRNESIAEFGFVKDINIGVRTGNTVVLDFCIPIAIALNYKNIYMIGCDFNYSKNSNKYFYGKPVSNQNLHESIDRDQWIDDVRLAFKIISSSEISNTNIYNFNSKSTNDIIPNYNLNEVYNNI
tara:strand:+ start:17341 stop:18093 length:753 start_codon:yes stop_codon:yes gene_type:complete